MRAHLAATIAFAILSGTASTAFDGAPAPTADGVKFRCDSHGLIAVPVTINGGGPFTFLLDTGANRSAISATLAERLALPAVATTALVSSTSSAKAAVVRLDGVSVGSVAKRGLLVPVLPSAAQTALGSAIDGVLGQDFLLDENYTLDYARLRLVWHADVTPVAGDARLVLKKDEGRWLVAIPQGADGPTPWFVPDSGASAFVVFGRGTAPPSLRVTPISGVQVSTVVDSRESVGAILHTLRVGRVVFREQPAVVIRQNADAPAADGLLPLAAFAQVTFDARAGVMSVRR